MWFSLLLCVMLNISLSSHELYEIVSTVFHNVEYVYNEIQCCALAERYSRDRLLSPNALHGAVTCTIGSVLPWPVKVTPHLRIVI